MDYKITQSQLNSISEKFDFDTFTPEKFAYAIKDEGIYHPEVVIAQSIEESGWYKSDIFKENNNPFGMKKPSIRTTTATGENRGHATYSNWRDSVKDYKLWQDYYEKKRKEKGKQPISTMTQEEYLKLLDSIYCFPPDCKQGSYSQKVRKLLGKAKEFLNNTSLLDIMSTKFYKLINYLKNLEN